MKCNHCDSPIEQGSEFCPNCGQKVDTSEHAATIQTPATNANSSKIQFTSKKRNKKAIYIGVGIGIVVLGVGSAAAAVTKPFTSPKQLLLESVNNQTAGSTVSKQSVEEKIHLGLNNISVPQASASDAGIVKTLNGSTIDLDVLFAPSTKEAQVDFTTNYQSVAHKGSLWVTQNSAILNMSDYQSLLNMMQPGIKIPKYLTTDSTQASDIAKFWSQVEKSPTQLTTEQTTAIHDLESMLINAIPDKYIHRSGIMSIQISFDQAGFQDIMKSVVKTIYENKDKFANDVSQIESTSPAASGGLTPADLKNQILTTLNQTPQEEVLGGIASVFNTGAVSIHPTSLEFDKGLFGSNYSEHMSSGISLNIPEVGVGANVSFSLDATSPSSKSISVPTIAPGDSQTFSDWSQQNQ